LRVGMRPPFVFAHRPRDGLKEGSIAYFRGEWWENPFPRTGSARVRLRKL
jgi:hypothetical protein